jgi:undecaprenyl phosphate-alpha-L-ara4N flippase subunit ArnE
MKMLYLLLFMLVQQAMSVAGQLLLKMGMAAETDFSWTWHNVGHLFINLYLQLGLWLLIGANVFWLWLLNKYAFSLVYPLTSLGFVFSVISGMIVFHEHVAPIHWLGVILIMAGCFCIARVV